MLNLNEFTEGVIKGLEVKLEDCIVIKASSEKTEGISIIENENESPVIPMENYYEAYMHGVPLIKLVDDIYNTYNNLVRSFGMGDTLDLSFDKIKDRIVMRVVNDNDESLDRLISSKVSGNLSLVYAIYLDQNHGSLITKEIADDCGWEREKIVAAAKLNTPKLLPATLASMESVAFLLPENRATLNDIDGNIKSGMFVLSNKNNIYGAAALYYEGATEKIAEIIDDDFYIIPASKHEVLICPASLHDPVYLEEVLVGTNTTVVKPEDVLGDKVLYCNAAEKYISIANPNLKIVSNEIEDDFEIE